MLHSTVLELSDLQVTEIFTPETFFPRFSPLRICASYRLRDSTPHDSYFPPGWSTEVRKPQLRPKLSMGRLGLHRCTMRTSTHDKSKVPSANHQSASDPYRTMITAVVHRHFCVNCTQTLRR